MIRFHGICPILRGDRALNNALCVFLPPEEVTLADGQSPAGRKAQEVVDWYHRWLVAWPAPAGVALLVDVPIKWAFVIMVALLASLWWWFFPRHFEYVGHEAEIIVATREGWAGYRGAEVERMLTRDRTFRGMDRAEVLAGLRNRRWLASLLVKVLRL